MTDLRDEQPPAASPKLLLEDSHPIGGALRDYALRTQFGFGEARAWEALQQRRKRARSVRPLAAVSALALTVAMFTVWSTHHASHAPIAAEPLPLRRPVSNDAQRLAKGNDGVPQLAPAEPAGRALVPKKATRNAAPHATSTGLETTAPATSAALTASAEQAPLIEGRPDPGRPDPGPASVASAAPPAPASSTQENHPDPCIQEQRAGHYELALRCFQNVAAGNGVGAELALYEQARLESAVLGRPEAALKTLDDHLRRFPAGALSSEARLMKLGLLAQTGAARALPEVEAALAGPLGAERHGDLLFLRGNILKARGRCSEALASYAQAELAGISHQRVERAMRQCRESH